MNKETAVIGSLLLVPLIGTSGWLVTAIGFALIFCLLIAGYALLMWPLRRWIHPPQRLLASILLGASLVSCSELLLQAWSLELHQALTVYLPLVSLQIVLMEYSYFFARSARQCLCTLAGFCALLLTLSLLREALGNGTLLAHWQWLTGAAQSSRGWVLFTPGEGIRLLTLVPGGFILLGLLLAARQAWWPTTRND